MIDKKLFLHLLKSELSWKKIHFAIAGIFSLIGIILIIIAKNYNSSSSRSIETLGMITGISLLLSIIIDRIFIGHTNHNQISRTVGFSFKYLHSIAHCQRKFILSFSLVGITQSFLFVCYAFILFLIYKLNLNFFFASIPAFLLLICFIRLTTIYYVIQSPRQLSYNSNISNFSYLKRFLIALHGMINLGLAISGSALFIFFVVEYHTLYMIPAITLVLIIYCILQYNITQKIWRDERFSKWNYKRNFIKTFLRLSIILSFGFLNYHIHGNTFTEGTTEVANVIQKGDLKTLKKMRITKKMLSNKVGHYTPLMKAVIYNKFDFVKFLIEKGADQKEIAKGLTKSWLMYRNGMNSLMLAIDMGHFDIVEFLVENGGDVNSQTHNNVSALSAAMKRCDLDIIEYLIKKGANVNSSDKSGRTAIFHATHRMCIISVIMLKNYGANLNHRNKSGKTFLEYAKKSNPRFIKHFQYIKSLLKE